MRRSQTYDATDKKAGMTAAELVEILAAPELTEPVLTEVRVTATIGLGGQIKSLTLTQGDA